MPSHFGDGDVTTSALPANISVACSGQNSIAAVRSRVALALCRSAVGLRRPSTSCCRCRGRLLRLRSAHTEKKTSLVVASTRRSALGDSGFPVAAAGMWVGTTMKNLTRCRTDHAKNFSVFSVTNACMLFSDVPPASVTSFPNFAFSFQSFSSITLEVM